MGDTTETESEVNLEMVTEKEEKKDVTLETESASTSGKSATSRRYYTPREVAAHSSDDDCWVSFLGNVYDLTELHMVRH